MSQEKEKFNPEVASIPIVEKKEKEMQFSNNVRLRPAGGNFSILKPKDCAISAEDVANGFVSTEDKVNLSLSILLKGLPRQLHNPQTKMTQERTSEVMSLRAGKATFVSIDKGKISESFLHASEKFEGSEPGLIIFPETTSVINYFSAVKYTDGTIARLIKGKEEQNMEDFVAGVNLLTPKTEFRKIGEEQVAYATEFVKGGERPKQITEQELEDWIERAR